MGFPQTIADEVLVRCSRHCCLCGKYAGLKIELHHIRQVADGGKDTADNCIPLCLDCHAEVGSYNTRHPKGRKFTEKELKGHRDKYYAMFSNMLHHIDSSADHAPAITPIFPPKNSISASAWGYSELDKLLPLLPGKTILVSGYTGTRKSTYVHHIVNTNLRLGQRIAYCCLKDSPLDVGYNIIAECTHINSTKIKHGQLSKNERKIINTDSSIYQSKNLALFPPDKFTHGNDIISIIETSGAELVIVDDLNGLLLEDSTVERFMYQLRNAALKKSVIVIVIYNLSVPSKRMDMRPTLNDFPMDSYYRLFDYIQFLFTPSSFYDDKYFDKNELELIIAKGIPGKTENIRMCAPSEITGVFIHKRN